MLSIIDEMLIGLLWKLEEGGEVVWVGAKERLEGGSRAFWGINSQDKSYYRTVQERLRAKWPLDGGVMICVSECVCLRTQYISPSLLAVMYIHRQTADFFPTQINTTSACVYTHMHPNTLRQTDRNAHIHIVAFVLFQ